MSEVRRRAYLEAMGFDVWVARPPDLQWDRLQMGPGQGSTLLVCASPEEGESTISSDIARAIGGDPVWAWPDPQDDPEAPRLEDAVRDRLFTRVIVFGEIVAERLFGGLPPDVLLSSAVNVTCTLGELSTRGSAKRALWQLLRQEPGTGGEGGAA